MEVLGWKYNISDIQSALLIGQLEKIEDRLAKREELARFYEAEFDKNAIIYVKTPIGAKSARHLFVIKTDKRDEVIAELQKNGVSIAVNYLPVHLNSFYKQNMGFREGDYPVAEKFGSQCVSLPLYPKLDSESISYICKTVSNTIRELHGV
jgi:dTDP-4-amino-4,6-dideoxygalactose transaminase